MTLLTNLWVYRGFVLHSISREFRNKYRNSILGSFWAVISPLAMILVYTLILSQLMSSRLVGSESEFAYSIYLCAGVLTWGLFSEISLRSINLFIDNANVLKKINFPRISLLVIIVASSILNFGIIFGIFTIFLVISGNFPGLPFLALIPLALLVAAFSASLGFVMGVMNVFYRDVGHFYNVSITFWFWLTPIVYPVSIIPTKFYPIFELNPLLPIITSVQQIVLQGQWPKWEVLIYPVTLTGLLMIAGVKLYKNNSSEIMDQL